MKRIKPGQMVYWCDKPAIVVEFKGLSEVILKSIETGESIIAPASGLSRSPVTKDSNHIDKEHIFTEHKYWVEATKRYEAILPLLSKPNRQQSDIQAVADKVGRTYTTIYRWIKRFEETGLVSSLLRPTRSDKGAGRLDEEVEEIINKNISEYYLSKTRPSPSAVYERVKLECYELGLAYPHQNTVFSRIKTVNDREETSKRFSAKRAREKYEPLRGSFPGADYPNAVVQIDHTPVDIIIVDDEHRLPIGRPNLTIAIDVATKMLSGFCLTLDPVGASSAGLCIAHAIQKKDLWMAKRDLDAEWPIHGLMRMIHMDNAKEFRGAMLERACGQYGIIMENRPKGQPNYGPHVERAFLTFMKKAHTLPGTTFSNIAEKLEYDSEGRACLTLDEFNLWFSIFITYKYHHDPHNGNNGISPLQMYSDFIHGNSERPGVGLPMAVEDEETLRLNFTPYVERTVQRHGVVLDHIHYFSDVLRKWVNRKDPETGKVRKFIFVRDPRDISILYFLDPDTKTYTPIPYLNITRPAMSLWELRAVESRLKKDHLDVNEEMIFKGLIKMREIEEAAIEKTRLAKQSRAKEKKKLRMSQRRKAWEGIHENVKTAPVKAEPIEDDDDIQPFSDIEHS